MSILNKILVITGPTASGKSSLAMSLAQKLDGEIISADSMQVYRKLDIGTAKPTPEDRQKIAHHLLDICDPDERFTVATYLRLAREKIRDILDRGKSLIVCGGTGLYVKALVEGLDFEDEEEDMSIRKMLGDRLEKEGHQALYDELDRLDPEAAKATHPNNATRVIRSLEIIYQTGKPATVYRRETAEAGQAREKEFDFSVYLPRFEREVLYDRINRRVDIMIREGLTDEARYLMDLNLDSHATALQAIGYKELFPYLKGEESLEESVERLKMASRRYAKRQLTWYRPISWVREIDGNQTPDQNADFIIRQNMD